MTILIAQRQRALRSLLQILPRFLPLQMALPISATLPEPGQHRVRKLIHRGAMRPTTKFLSVKLDRSVHCESALEADCAYLLDACPKVESFAEQPAVLHYFQDGILRRHVPDFFVVAKSNRYFVEVKFERDLDEDINRRTELLKALLKPLGFSYHVVTENIIRSGAGLDNAHALLLRGREQPTDIWSLSAHHAIRQSEFLPLAYFGWHRSGELEAAWIARLILQGQIHVDLSQKITTDSMVSVNPLTIKENALWPSAALK